MHFSLILHTKTKADAIVPVFFMFIRINFIHRKIETKKKMKKFYTMLLLAAATCGTASAQYQLVNSGFETWESVKSSVKSTVTGDEPVKWSSFVDMKSGGALYNSASQKQLEKSTDVRPGSSGTASAYIYAKKVAGIATAQGNLTTGCVYGGSMSPTDAKGNYNFTNTAREDQSMKFSGRPDVFRVWIKSSTKYNFNISVLLHKQGYYQDPYANQNGIVALVAHAKATPASNNNVWTKYEIPVEYDDNTVGSRPYYALVTFATSAVPGQADVNDKMWIDDAEFVYYSELATAKYDGADVTFTNGAATVDAEYDESLLSLTSNGKGATIEKNYDATTGLLTITVKGDNISEDATNKHLYTIQFATPKAKATMSVSAAAGWGTFCAPFAVTAPSGVTASTIRFIGDNGQLTLLPVRNGAIPANTPVILKSTSNVSTTFEGDAVEGNPSNKNYLTGVYVDTPAPVGSYVLQNQSDVVGFYLVEDVQPTIKANRCYLTLPAGNSARALFFDESDFVTALDNAIIVDEPEAAYDLQGRRVNVAGQKGMFIIGGRKVIK